MFFCSASSFSVCLIKYSDQKTHIDKHSLQFIHQMAHTHTRAHNNQKSLATNKQNEIKTLIFKETFFLLILSICVCVCGKNSVILCRCVWPMQKKTILTRHPYVCLFVFCKFPDNSVVLLMF